MQGEQGYSQGYKTPIKRFFEAPLRKLPLRYRCLGDLTIGGSEDYKFLANLLGLKFEIWSPEKRIDRNKQWDDYWEALKNNIKNGMPVISALDPIAWPLYREHRNWTGKIPVLPRSCCITLVVGFNQSNNSVCIIDQYVGAEKGNYIWVNVSDFKTSVERATYYINDVRYRMYLFEKNDIFFDEEFVYKQAHIRNIERIKGEKTAYDPHDIHTNFKELGINALKSMRQDIKTSLIRQIALYNIINRVTKNIIPSVSEYPFKQFLEYFEDEAKGKQIASDVLKEKIDMYDFHRTLGESKQANN